MELKAKETIAIPSFTFLGLVVVATLGWLLLLFLIATAEHGPMKLLIEVIIEGLKVAVIGAAAALVLEQFLRRTHGDTPETLLRRVGINAVFPSRRDQETATEFLRLATDPNVKRLVIMGISLRDFLLGNGSLHPIWRAIQERLEHENNIQVPGPERLHVRVLLLEPRSNEGCFRHEVEGHNVGAPGGGIPFDVPQGIGTVAAAQQIIYEVADSEFLKVRLYEHCPFAFMWATNTEILVEQYDYRDQTKDAALPLISYKSGTRQFDELFNSIEQVWKHAHAVDLMNEVGTATTIREARVRNIFRRDDRAHLSKRQVDTLAVTEANSLIRIMAITGRFYTSYTGMAPLLRRISKSDNETPGAKVHFTIVNPVSQQAILRAVADESPPKDIRNSLQEWNWTKHQETSLYRDTMRTIHLVQQWMKEGSQIEVRLYSSSIACALLLSDNSAFIEQYVYGRSKIFQPGLALGGEYPVVEYEKAGPDGGDTIEKEILEDTFDIVWDSYSIAQEDYVKRNPAKEFEKNLSRLLEELGASTMAITNLEGTLT